MKLKNSFLYGAILLLLASCSNEESQTASGYGTVNVQVSADYNVIPVLRSTAATTATTENPDASEFALKLVSTNGEYSRGWDNLASFDPTAKIPVGDYTMSAFYGDINIEGFDKPYYYGESSVSVRNNENSPVDILCSLYNVKVTVEYSEAFKNYFADYSTKIQSTGGEFITFAKYEQRAAYVKPGKIKIQTYLKKQNGVTSTFEPTAIPNATARQHYKIKLDISNNAAGEAELNISFDETTETEPVKIDISDEVMAAPAPTFTVSGFESGVPVEVKEYCYAEQKNLNVSLVAKGGITSCVLTTNSTCLLEQGWPVEIDLANMTPSQAELMKQLGLKVKGLDSSDNKMGFVDFTEVFTHLDATKGDQHTFTLLAKDNGGKVTEEPTTLSVKSIPLTFNLQEPQAVFVGNNEVVIPVEFDGNNIESMRFSYINQSGAQVNAPATVISENNGIYQIKIEAEVINRALQVTASFANGAKTASISVPVKTPEFTISAEEYDIWAKKATVKLTATDAQYQKAVEQFAVLYTNHAGSWNVANMTRNGNLVTITGLTPNMQYQLKGSCNNSQENIDYSGEYSFTTETANVVPNGDFEDLIQTISISSIDQGGKWSDLGHWVAQQTQTSYNVSEPQGWASVNAKTCNYNGANAKNTWFVVPSTLHSSDYYTGANAMILKNVSWDLAGSVPGRDTNTDTHPYSDKTPSTIGNTSAGKLFLGSYSYNTAASTETYNEGVSFNSRPLKLTGYYKYATDSQDAGETGMVQVTLLNGDTEIATGTGNLQATSSYTKFEIPINYMVTDKKATSLRIMISSSNHASYNQSEETATIKTTKYATETQQSATGATLTIDNLNFSYE